MRRFTTLSVVLLFVFGLAGANLAQAATLRAKPPSPRTIVKIAPRSIRSGGTVSVGAARAGVPAHGRAAVVLKAAAFKAFRAAMRKREGFRPAPHASGPAHGTFTRLVGSASTAHGRAYWNGSRWVAPAGATRARPSPRLLVPRPSGSAGRVRGQRQFPSVLYGSTQVDSATSGCSNPFPNEASVAQSSDNPNYVVVAAQAYVDANGNCDDSHP